MYERSFAAGAVADFKQRLLDRLRILARDAGEDTLVLPVGLFLVLDKVNGGDKTAEEIIQRFAFVDSESRNVLDFYLLGWQQPSPHSGALEFDLEVFGTWRDSLRNVGIRTFGGNADLILLDAHLSGGRVQLDFTRALHIDIAAAITEKRINSVGGFLQSLIEAAEQVRSSAGTPAHDITYSISDRLGLAVARLDPRPDSGEVG